MSINIRTLGPIISAAYKDYTTHRLNSIKQIVQSLFFLLLFLYIWNTYQSDILSFWDKNALRYFGWENNIILKICTSALVFLLICTLAYRYESRFILPKSYRYLWIASFIIYYSIRFSSHYSFQYYIGMIAYTDVFIIYGIISYIIHIVNSCRLFIDRLRINEKFPTISLIPDRPIKQEQRDLLDYSIEAHKISDEILNIQEKESFSIGIVGPWGSGKSSLLNLIGNLLSHKDCIIVNYNPRTAKNTNEIQEDFFNTLCHALEKYDYRFSQKIKEYMHVIQIIDKENLFNKLYRVFEHLTKESQSKLKEDINQRIEKIHKKLIIIIEDIDRLIAEEIIEVFKLIDINASFENTIFITAYDKEYISRSLGEKYCTERNNFAEKFFDCEFYIPLRPAMRTFDFIRDQILNQIPVAEKDIILDEFSNCKPFIVNHITNLREAKRFVNLFLHDYTPIQNEVNFEDFILVTLLKFIDYPFYHDLFIKQHLTEGNGHFEFDDLGVSNGDIALKLFPGSSSRLTQRDQYRRIHSVKAFDTYFVTQIYELLPKNDMQETLNKSFFTYSKDKIDTWDNKNYIYDYIEFLNSRNTYDFNDKNQFFNYIQDILYTDDKKPDTELYYTIKSLLDKEDTQEFCKIYDFKYDEYIDLFNQIFTSTETPYYSIIKKLIINTIDNQSKKDKMIFDKEQLLSYNKTYLVKYIDDNPIMNQKHMELLYSCIYNIDPYSRKVILDKDSCQNIKELILSTPDYYISSFVRLGAISSNTHYNTIAGEPFWEQIFGSGSEFEKFLGDKELDRISHIEGVRKFWKLYTLNEFKPIEVNGEFDVKNQIDNDLEDLSEDFLKRK